MRRLRHNHPTASSPDCAACDEDQRIAEWLQDHPDDEPERDE